jgi:hypothetical protein
VSETERHPVGIVLDTTAVIAWCRESLAVGELLAIFAEDKLTALIPLACLVESAHKTRMLKQDRLTLLVNHAATSVVADNPDDWPGIAATRGIVDPADLASAAWLAMGAEVDIMTREPRWYSSVNDVLEFDD